MLLHPKGSKKKLLILIAAVVVTIGVLVGLAFWLKAGAESGATSSIKQAHADINSALKTLNGKLIDTKLSSSDKVKAFTDLEGAITKTDSTACSSESKNIMFGLSNAKSRCDDAHKKLASIKASVQKIENSVKDDQTLSGVLAPIKAADAASPTKQLEAWTAVSTNVAKVSTSSIGTALKKQLTDVSSAYKTAWQELIDADKAQNKTNYDDAIKKIDTAKDALSKIATDQTVAFKESLVQFKKAVDDFK